MVRVSSAVCIGFLSVLLFYGLRTHFWRFSTAFRLTTNWRRPPSSLARTAIASPTHSIAAIIFHTAPVRACRYPPEDESDDGEMDHRLNLLLVLSSRPLELSAI